MAAALCQPRAARRRTAQPQGPPPATGVQLVTLQNKPIEDASEFISTVRSLHSTTVQPQVEGTVTKIYVKSGSA